MPTPQLVPQGYPRLVTTRQPQFESPGISDRPPNACRAIHRPADLHDPDTNQWNRYKHEGIEYCCELLSDHETDKAENIEKFVRFFRHRALPFIAHAHAEGKPVLVHCNAGMNRSASVLIGYEMYRAKLRFDDVFQRVQTI